MTIFAPLNLLTIFGMAALGLCLALFQIFRTSVREKQRSAVDSERVRDLVRSTLRELMTIPSVDGTSPGAPESASVAVPIEPGDRMHSYRFGAQATRGTVLLGRVETELLQKVRRYQLGRPSEKWMNEGEAQTNFHSTPAIS
jgi:hypothetical protein